jgi:hypothetical protein
MYSPAKRVVILVIVKICQQILQYSLVFTYKTANVIELEYRYSNRPKEFCEYEEFEDKMVSS